MPTLTNLAVEHWAHQTGWSVEEACYLIGEWKPINRSVDVQFWNADNPESIIYYTDPDLLPEPKMVLKDIARLLNKNRDPESEKDFEDEWDSYGWNYPKADAFLYEIDDETAPVGKIFLDMQRAIDLGKFGDPVNSTDPEKYLRYLVEPVDVLNWASPKYDIDSFLKSKVAYYHEGLADNKARIRAIMTEIFDPAPQGQTGLIDAKQLGDLDLMMKLFKKLDEEKIQLPEWRSQGPTKSQPCRDPYGEAEAKTWVDLFNYKYEFQQRKQSIRRLNNKR